MFFNLFFLYLLFGLFLSSGYNRIWNRTAKPRILQVFLWPILHAYMLAGVKAPKWLA